MIKAGRIESLPTCHPFPGSISGDRRGYAFDFGDIEGYGIMGQDYSYSQPSSSEVSLTWLLQEEADVYADEAQSRLNLQVPVQYVPQPDVEEGTQDIRNILHTERSREKTQLRQLKDQGNESEEKVVKLKETVCELAKKNSGVTTGFHLLCCLIGGLVIALLLMCLPGAGSKA
ncbi:hypothetical protein Bca52824_089088 [Brassica carinata]|uniref:Uncharacterized protein n=1 Tax=Brassica carinata TaxID=52824 RepID=A0A8X7PDT0_BRACI|nr:hypothetical protein Bca52824_089088 [Brassica carinata]